jgi:uncharacterized cupredoxin-like copper-binding protein
MALAVAALGVAGCGDDDDGSNGSEASGEAAAGGYGSREATGDEAKAGAGGGTMLRLSVDPGGALKFDKSSLSTKAGKVTIVMKNPSSATAPHAVEIEGNGVEKESAVVDPGGTASVSATLEPGEYEFYCPVGNHADAGMEGTLTVK